MTQTETFTDLNAYLNIIGSDNKVQFDKDKEALRVYFIDHVNQNTVFFHSLKEKLEYLFENGYYKKDIFDQYDSEFVKNLYKRAYDKKYRFETFVGAFKFYTSYAMKTTDGTRYLERYEDRVVAVALTLAKGNSDEATNLVDEIMSSRFQPATPTFLNAGKVRAGEQVSCFLMRTEDNFESIFRTINGAGQLSKRGGGVAISLTNLREVGAPIKGVENLSTGVIPVMKILEDTFSYADQLGARQGAGAVYLNAHHPDIMRFFDTKRENADEKIRIKTLSLGVVIPDITMQLARDNEPMYLFSPYDVEKEYGIPMSDISITEKYYEMVENPRIRKKKINPREFFQTIAELQFESGYPYILYEDTASRANTGGGRINMSNLCSEILQENTASLYNEDLSYSHVGTDISCNLGSMNVAKMMETPDFSKSVETAVRALTNVSLDSNINCVPSIQKGNQDSHAIGLGQMNLHGFFGKSEMFYGSPESIDFTNIYFYTILFNALKASNKIAIEKNEKFVGFEKSSYASGKFFTKYIEQKWVPETDKVRELFKNIHIPTQADWVELSKSIMEHGIYNKYLQAVPPTGSISYINNSTASIHPIVSAIEVRKEGKMGRVYYPAPYLTNDNMKYYQNAYDIGPEKLIDVYAAATQHVDQGLSCTLFFPSSATTRDINKAQIYAYKKGIKTIYYIRIKQESLTGGSKIDECVACAL